MNWPISCLLISLFCLLSKSGTAQEILVRPYLQPGNAPNLNKEQKVVIWQTDSVVATYIVQYGEGSSFDKIVKWETAKITETQLKLNSKTTFLYRAVLSGLSFDSQYCYKVNNAGAIIGEGSFFTRTKKGKTRFVAFGDCGTGSKQQAEIAYQVYQQKPQFVLVTGDNVYSRGLAKEYQKNFFPIYLSSETTPEKGAPLMNSIPFYLLLGNHDIYGANLDKYSDGLAYFYYNDLPTNAPIPKVTIEATGSEQRIKEFKKNTKNRFPGLANYSFEHGNVHITCLDANIYVDPLDPAIVQWLRDDLANSKADWKIVAYHHPGFNSSSTHYTDQWMRLLAPLLQELKVDLVLSGHVHNYQRSVPLVFEPQKDQTGEHYIMSKEGRVDGVFTLDTGFDGISKTKPKGIIYMVTGAGGAVLYDTAINRKPERWTHTPAENWVPFTAKLISDVHSFTLIETDERKLTLKQLDAKGVVLDEMIVTK
jgi:predicted MPP superfamily phosphohydrolase